MELWNPIETIRVPPVKIERSFSSKGVDLKRVVTPFVYPLDAKIRLEYNINGTDGGMPVSFRSTHEILLHSCNVIEYFLGKAGFGSITWYSALSEGFECAKDTNRMLLVCAQKVL
jgi:hypothetical protein